MNIIRYVYLAATSVVCTTVVAQKTIMQEDCWFDGKYQSIQAVQPEVDISMMQPGIHSYTMRVKDSEGLWSSPVTRYFLIPTARTEATEISQREYWLDGKFSERTSLGVSPAMLDISPLDVGIHSLTMRVKNNADIWSNPVTRYFIIPTTTMKANEIVEREYWLDGKIIQRKPLGLSTAVIDIGELNKGIHSLSIRVKDDAGVWSNQLTRYFIIPQEVNIATKIVERQYWFDGKLAARASLDESPATIQLTDLLPGIHSMTVRVKDDKNVWSTPVTKFFVIPEPLIADKPEIVKYAYWIDGDINNITTRPLTENSGVMMIDISDVEAGQHNLSWMVGDSNGKWSKAVTQPFISVSFYTYTVPASGVGTFSASTIVAVPDELTTHYTTVYCPEFIYGPSMQIEDVGSQYIPANTGILLRGEPGTTHIIRYSEETPATINDNSLVAVVEPTHIPQTNGAYTNFILKDGNFVKVKDQTEEHKMPANRAYLPIVLGNDAPERISVIWAEQDATSILEPSANNPVADGIVYDIQGRKIGDTATTPISEMHLKSGVYIINGKKILVK